MKTVMKKLLSLMLVAVLLVSAVPFQASAAMTPNEDGAISVPVVVYLIKDSEGTLSGAHNKTLLVKDGETVTLDEATALGLLSEPDGRTLNVNGWVDNAGLTVTGNELTYAWLATDATEEYSLTVYVNEKVDTGNVPPEGPSDNPSGGDENDTPEEVILFKAYINGKIDKVISCKLSDVVSNGKVVYLPTPDAVSGYNFQKGGWYTAANGQGEKIQVGDTWHSDSARQYFAYYIEDEKDDHVSELTVFAKVYVGGVLKSTTKLYSQQFNDGDNMLTWLKNYESTTADYIFGNVVSSNDYEWTPRYYYDYSGNEPLTSQDLVANGDKSVVVKVYSKKATEANVLLYVHKNTTSTSPSAIYEMTGYTKGDTVSKSAVTTLIKKHYTGSNMTIQGLYTDTTWAQLVNGEKPTASNGIAVEDNGTLKIHVLLKNATASENGEESDSTNPKTGDMIFVPMIFMLVSAAAIVACVYGKKRMVK